jgi:hypothetical protein
MIPSGYKEDTVFSAIPTDGSGDLSFTRASNGTRINSAGLVEVTPWNLLEQSENFDNAYWFKARMSITANSTAAPNGTLTADSFVENSTNDSHPLYTISPAVIQGLVYTISVYLKKGSRNYFNITPIAGNSVFFDLNNGTATGTGASIESVGNGWYRCIATYTASSTNADIYFQPSPNGTDTYYQGNGSVSAYIWGAQLNIGSTAKPYFPTTDRLNVPRLTYQNGGGGCPSLLLEKQSTNLLTYSEDFTQTAWDASNLTITANDATSPDGTQNAEKFTTLSTSAENQARQGTFSILGNVGSSYTTSVYAKKGTANYLRIRNLFVQNGDTLGNAWFNLNTGAVGTVQSSQTASIQNMGNGWYRCILTGVVGSSNNYNFVDIGFSDGETNIPTTSVNGYVWGAQLE